jgi:hypothetical protein
LIGLQEKVLPLSQPAIFELLDVRPKNWPAYVPYLRAASSGEATDKGTFKINLTSLFVSEYEDFADYPSDDDFVLLE